MFESLGHKIIKALIISDLLYKKYVQIISNKYEKDSRRPEIIDFI